jgi:hypothetical protein
MMADTEQKKQEIFLVWNKTEKAGHIVQIDDNVADPKWTYFTDGSRIDKKLINEFLLRTTSLEEAKKMSQTLGFDPSMQPALPSQSQNNTLNTALTAQDVSPAQSIKPVEEAKQKGEPNIMMAMLEKMSKKNTASMPLEINLPSREVYDMLIDQMDVEAEELKEQIVLLIESQIDSMKQKLNEQIQLFTNNYYNDGKNTTSTKQKNAKSNSETERNS